MDKALGALKAKGAATRKGSKILKAALTFSNDADDEEARIVARRKKQARQLKLKRQSLKLKWGTKGMSASPTTVPDLVETVDDASSFVSLEDSCQQNVEDDWTDEEEDDTLRELSAELSKKVTRRLQCHICVLPIEPRLHNGNMHPDPISIRPPQPGPGAGGTLESEAMEKYSFSLACGSNATFKWLANAAVQRYTNVTAQRSGQRRQREIGAAPIAGSAVMPMKVTTGEKVEIFHHPNAKLFEGPQALRNGQNVYVTLRNATSVRQYEPEARPATAGGHCGSPKKSNWATVAFCHSNTSRQQRALNEELTLQKHRLEQEKADREAEYAAAIAHKVVHMRQLLREQIDLQISDDEIEEQERSVEQAVGFIKDEEERELVQSMLTCYAPHINEIFRNFSTNPTFGGDKDDEMSFPEWQRLIKTANIYSTNKEFMTKSKEVFLRANVEDANEKLSLDSKLSSCEFYCALHLLAKATFMEFEDEQGAAVLNVAERASIKMKNYSAALHKLVTGYILPLIQKTSLARIVKEAIGSDDILCLLYDHLPTLQDIFKKYGSLDDMESSMSMEEFCTFSHDLGMLGFEESKQIFASAQTVAATSEEERLAGYHHSDLMVFGEFIEAIARVGVLKWYRSPDPIETKIERSVLHICRSWVMSRGSIHSRGSGRSQLTEGSPGGAAI